MRDYNMKRNFSAAFAFAAVTALGCASVANAQQNTQQPSVDPSFSAYTLVQECSQKSDNAAQGQCVGAVRGIVRGYQYGVLFLGQRSQLKANETQRVSLCLSNTPVSTLVDEFLADAKQVDEASLKRTPAEVAVLGSVHSHHACM
jgi:Rap1a immunity proteins